MSDEQPIYGRSPLEPFFEALHKKNKILTDAIRRNEEPPRTKRGPAEVLSLDGYEKPCDHIIGMRSTSYETFLCVQGGGERPNEPFKFCPDCGESLTELQEEQ